MKRGVLVAAVALSLAAPATADEAVQLRPSLHVATDGTIGAMLSSRPDTSRPVRLSFCRGNGKRGSCRFRVRGTSRCVGRIQVRYRARADEYDYWASWLRCR